MGRARKNHDRNVGWHRDFHCFNDAFEGLRTRRAAVGAAGQGPWSEPVSLIVT